MSGRAAVAAAGLTPDRLDHVVYGNALQTSGDAIYLARHVGLGVGTPDGVPALTVHRLCGSGFQAIASGAHEILHGGARAVLCGGTESMSQAPHVVRGARRGNLRLGIPAATSRTCSGPPSKTPVAASPWRRPPKNSVTGTR